MGLLVEMSQGNDSSGEMCQLHVQQYSELVAAS